MRRPSCAPSSSSVSSAARPAADGSASRRSTIRCASSTSTPRRARLHRELARSHEHAATGDYEALAHHLHELGEDERAGHYAELAGHYAEIAGDRASASLAFGTAASHYARAIEWLPARAEPWDLHRKLAECEANRGHPIRGSAYKFERLPTNSRQAPLTSSAW